MSPISRTPLRLVAATCVAAVLAFGSGAAFAQTGLGGSSPTTGTTARGESGSPSAPTVQMDPGNKAATNGAARIRKDRAQHRRQMHHARAHAHRKAVAAAPAAPMASSNPVPPQQPQAATGTMPAGTAVQTQSSRVDSTGTAPKTGEPSRTPATTATPGK